MSDQEPERIVQLVTNEEFNALALTNKGRVFSGSYKSRGRIEWTEYNAPDFKDPANTDRNMDAVSLLMQEEFEKAAAECRGRVDSFNASMICKLDAEKVVVDAHAAALARIAELEEDLRFARSPRTKRCPCCECPQ